MRILSLVIASTLLIGGCRERSETTVTETRSATMRDENLKLGATSNERFGTDGAIPGLPQESTQAPDPPVIAKVVPDDWKEEAGNAFRLLNYSFGTAGEVSVSLSRGGVTDNVNRWVGQFGRPPLDAAGLAALEKVSVAGFEGVLVSADGDYAPGMGRPSQADFGLIGAVTEQGGRILTVKMIGPAADVQAQESNLRAFIGGLQPAE